MFGVLSLPITDLCCDTLWLVMEMAAYLWCVCVQALQVAMQGLLESLVVVDRLLFLRERGFSPLPVPLFDDLVSPRNIAIVTTLPGQDVDLEK